MTEQVRVEEAQPIPRMVQLPAPTVERLKNILAQRNAIDQQLQTTLLVALEAMGEKGEIQMPIDLAKGIVRIKPLPEPILLNRQQRRKAQKVNKTPQDT